MLAKEQHYLWSLLKVKVGMRAGEMVSQLRAHWFLKKTRVLFPEITLWLITIYNHPSKEFDGPSLNLWVTDLARLSGHQAPKIHLSLSPQCWDCRHVLPHLFLSWGAGDPNSDPQACSVRALPFTLAFCSCLSSEWFSLALSGVPSPGSGKGVNKQKSVGPSHRP